MRNKNRIRIYVNKRLVKEQKMEEVKKTRIRNKKENKSI